MSGLRVRFAPPTDAGRLYPRYDAESGIVAVESTTERSWPHGVDIDGVLICDLDADLVLANFDLHIPRRNWAEDDSLRWPAAQPSADLVFLQETVTAKSFADNVDAFFSPARDLLEIRIGNCEREPREERALSSTCVAVTCGGELAGFVVRLGPVDDAEGARR